MAIIAKPNSTLIKRNGRQQPGKQKDMQSSSAIPSDPVQLPDISKWGWDIFYILIALAILSGFLISRGQRGLLTSGKPTIATDMVNTLNTTIHTHIVRSEPLVSCDELGLAHAEVGSQLTVSYTLSSQTQPPKTHFSTFNFEGDDSKVLFDLRSVHSSLSMGSTMPLLHYGSLGLCDGQVRTVTVPNLPEVFTNDVLLAIFPAFALYDKDIGAIRSTITLPAELTIHVVAVDHSPEKPMEQRINENTFDLDTWHGNVRYYLATTNPLYIVILLAGLRVGKTVFTRYYRLKHQRMFAEARKASAQTPGALTTPPAS